MKQLLLKLLLLGALCFPLDRAIGWGIATAVKKRQVDHRITQLFEGGIQADVLLLGSSRALNNIDAGQLGEDLNRQVYNLGYSGSTLDFHASMFRIAEAAGVVPETLVLIMDERKSFVEAPEMGHYRLDKLLPFIEFRAVLQEVSTHSEKNYRAAQVSHAYRQNGNYVQALNYLTEGQEPRDETNAVDAFGSVILDGHSPNFTKEYASSAAPYDSTQESESLKDAFHFLVTSCEEANITLYVVFPPNHYPPSTAFRERVIELGGKYPHYVVLSTSVTETRFFFDHGHMNRLGVDLFTKQLAEALQTPA